MIYRTRSLKKNLKNLKYDHGDLSRFHLLPGFQVESTLYVRMLKAGVCVRVCVLVCVYVGLSTSSDVNMGCSGFNVI